MLWCKVISIWKHKICNSTNVNKGNLSTVDAILSESAGTLIKKGNNNKVEQNLTLDENISAPISSGQKLGELSFVLDGKVISKVDIVAKNNVEKLNLFTMSKRVIYSWIDLLRS